MMKRRILWADDEIDMLKAHIILLEEKGYELTTVNNGDDAIAKVKEKFFDVVLLDEMMPGRDGLSTLLAIKDISPASKAIMITKSEEEHIMEEAIGKKIDDYLIKPIKPSQIFLSLKKVLDSDIISQKQISGNYLKDLRELNIQLMNGIDDADDWIVFYKKLCKYSLELASFEDSALKNTLKDIKKEANKEFSKFIFSNYENWCANENSRPIFSNDIFKHKIIPRLKQGKKVAIFILDCLRMDQYLHLETVLHDEFQVDAASYYSILPTATAFSRNAIFSGLFPDEFQRLVPKIWQSLENEESLNQDEEFFLDQQIKRHGIKSKIAYRKYNNRDDLLQLDKQFNELMQVQIAAVVINTIDIIAHTRSESKLVQELIPDDFAYCEQIKNWFQSTNLKKIFKHLVDNDFEVIISTDHGSIQCSQDIKVFADKETYDGMRFKFGRSLNIDHKHGIVLKDPKKYRLPKFQIVTEYLFAKENYYMVYPSQYRKYAEQFKLSYQHGGISMEEMILPCIRLNRKK
jgi:CheY-like chemotaxis protein